MMNGVSNQLLIRHFGQLDYTTSWQAMQTFTQNRTETSLDEVWFLEHSPVFTLGQNGKHEHILGPSTIPIVQTDRGGQVTYHGPGQLMMYTLVDLKRKKITIRDYVSALENAVVQLLAHYNIEGSVDCKAPGVYVNSKKICSIGLRVRKGATYHGLALNVSNDLTPFSLINPCGYQGLQMTSCALEGATTDQEEIAQQLIQYFSACLGYTLQQWQK